MRGFHFTGFQIVGSAYHRACCCTDGASRRATDQATHGRPPQCRSTDDLGVLHLGAVTDAVPVTAVAMSAVMMRAARLDSAMPDSAMPDSAVLDSGMLDSALPDRG